MTIVRRTILQIGTTIFSVSMFLGLTGCGGSKLLDDPEPVTIVQPLTTVSDQRLEAHLDWVIVRDGPGTWAKNADWDEYLLRVRNLSDEPIRITAVAILDSLDTRHESSANRKKLVKALHLPLIERMCENLVLQRTAFGVGHNPMLRHTVTI